MTGNEQHFGSLRRLKEIFSVESIPWMVVSGAAVFFYNNPERELTDIDTVIKVQSLSRVESYLKKVPEIDNLSRVSFIDKFGLVRPLTSYLRLFVNGIEVHVSSKWVYELDNKKKISIPYDNEAFSSSKSIKLDGFDIKVARPELVFLAKSITRRSFKISKVEQHKDLGDCELLVKGAPDFRFDYLEKLYENLGLVDLYREIALPIRKKYNR